MPLKTPWSRLSARPAPGMIHIVVETPRGSRNKYKYDPRLGLFRLNRVLPAGSIFPFDFGYIPQTLSGDDDPLDAVVLLEEATFAGCVIRARPLGVLRATKEGKENHRIIAVATAAKLWSSCHDLYDLESSKIQEIERFFQNILTFDITKHVLNGFRRACDAERIINRAIETAKEQRNKTKLNKIERENRTIRKDFKNKMSKKYDKKLCLLKDQKRLDTTALHLKRMLPHKDVQNFHDTKGQRSANR